MKSSALSSRNFREQKAKIEALVADISHQTKTPIANILLYAQLLEEQNIPEETRPLVTSLIGQSEKLKMLIEALVKTSRLETGIFQFHPKRNEVETMLAEAVRQYLPKAKKKQIRLTLETGDAEALFDSKWTAEAVGNLLDNAIKNTPSGGAVSVNVSEYDMFCRIDVSDNGCGIPEEEQAKVFQRFYRSPSAADAEGVGIGLFLTRQIITGQGGYGLCICLDLNDIRSLTEQVARCGNNLNQYVKRANENGSIYAADIMDLQELFQEILDTERSIFLKLAALK